MKLWALLLVLGCVHVRGAPVEQGGVEHGSCNDTSAKAAAELALTKINQDRQEGYIFSLHRLSNVHMANHGENGRVFYLTLDVVETNCSVLSKKDWKTCEARPTHDTPVYGQCKVAIYISKVHRVVRLYKYNCVVRPVPAEEVVELCPDCPGLIDNNNTEIQKTVSLSLQKFNKESGLVHRFNLLKVTRATSGMAMSMYYNAEYTIQETTCPQSTDAAMADKCPFMECEFAHKGFCKASHFHSSEGDDDISVECEIFEPEAAEREKKLHLLGGETDHSHSDAHTHSHSHDHDHGHGHAHGNDHGHGHAHGNDHGHGHAHGNDHGHGHAHGHAHGQGHAHAADPAHSHSHDHDHQHDHTKSHDHHNDGSKHDAEHHHTHDHAAGSGHRHAHAHSHDHGHGHNHSHAHHAKAHNHSDDTPHHHHNYKHADGVYTHEHDHELALDHDHKHAHLHEHEHHHHHHEHEHETDAHDHPEGTVRVLPAMGQPVTMPSFPDVPAGGPEVGVVLPLKPDPQIPGEMEPTIEAFPTSVSAQCGPVLVSDILVNKMFVKDPLFTPAA